MNTGPLTADFGNMRDMVAARAAHHQPMTVPEMHCFAQWCEAFGERLAALEDFQRLRALSGDVVRLRPALALIEGGRG